MARKPAESRTGNKPAAKATPRQTTVDAFRATVQPFRLKRKRHWDRLSADAQAAVLDMHKWYIRTGGEGRTVRSIVAWLQDKFHIAASNSTMHSWILHGPDTPQE